MLHTKIVTSEAFNNGNIEEAIMEGFLKVDEHILNESQVVSHHNITTQQHNATTQ
jgi:hypothetical protein